MGVVFGRLQRFPISDIVEGRPIGRLDPVPHPVQLAQGDGVHAQLAGQLVDRALHAKGRDRRAGRAIGGYLRAVGDHVPAGDAEILQVIDRQGGHRARAHRRAGKGAGLVFQLDLGRGDAAVLGGAQLDLDHGARGGAGGLEHLFAAHDHLHRRAALAREGQGHRLQIDRGLAAETPADLGRGHADVGDLQAQDLGAIGADHELALARGPDLALAILGHGADAGMRFDIALMHRLGGVATLDDHLGLGEALVDIAALQPIALGDVGRQGRALIQSFRIQMSMQHRRVGGHGRLHIDHVGQDLIGDLDQARGLLGDGGGGGGHRGQGVASVENLAAGHHVLRQVTQVRRALAGLVFLRGQVGEVLGGDDGLDPWQGASPAGVDGHDAGMGVGAALDLADQHAGQGKIGAIGGPPGDLVHAVRTHRPGADHLQLRPGGRLVHHVGHATALRACLRSAAASITARMILS